MNLKFLSLYGFYFYLVCVQYNVNGWWFSKHGDPQISESERKALDYDFFSGWALKKLDFTKLFIKDRLCNRRPAVKEKICKRIFLKILRNMQEELKEQYKITGVKLFDDTRGEPYKCEEKFYYYSIGRKNLPNFLKNILQTLRPRKMFQCFTADNGKTLWISTAYSSRRKLLLYSQDDGVEEIQQKGLSAKPVLLLYSIKNAYLKRLERDDYKEE